MEWLIAAGTAFAVIAPLELPDKTFVATLVLTTRYRPAPVWLGVATAFAAHTALAVTAGSFVALLPAQPVRLVAAGLFAVGAVVLLRSARGADAEERDQERTYAQKVGHAEHAEHAEPEEPGEPGESGESGEVAGRRRGRAAFGASFLLLFTAEWGDLSQLFTIGLVARGEPPAAVFLGAWGALAVVSGAAVLIGRWVVRRVRLSLVRYLAAAVCAALATLTLISAWQ